MKLETGWPDYDVWSGLSIWGKSNAEAITHLNLPQSSAQEQDENKTGRSSHCGSVVTNPTSVHEDMGLIPGLTQQVRDLSLSCAVV